MTLGTAAEMCAEREVTYQYWAMMYNEKLVAAGSQGVPIGNADIVADIPKDAPEHQQKKWTSCSDISEDEQKWVDFVWPHDKKLTSVPKAFWLVMKIGQTKAALRSAHEKLQEAIKAAETEGSEETEDNGD